MRVIVAPSATVLRTYAEIFAMPRRCEDGVLRPATEIELTAAQALRRWADEVCAMTYLEFTEALKAFCLKHGYEIAGTCKGEGIYGEISVYPIDAADKGAAWDENKFNFEPGAAAAGSGD